MNILIVRVSSLGDIIHNMPMATDLSRQFPTARIDWVVEEAYVPLVQLHQGISTIIPVAIRRWRKQIMKPATRLEIKAFYERLRHREYDIVIDSQGLIKSGVLMRLARLATGGKRIGMANGTEGSGYESLSRLFHTQSVPVEHRTHAVLRGRLIPATALNYPIDTPPEFCLRPPVLINQPAWISTIPYAVFFHATARPKKQWSLEGWAHIAKVLAQRKMPILLPWGTDLERQAAKELACRMDDAIVLPKLSMTEAVLLAQQATLVVGVDTGLTHIAAAYCRPTVELYCDSPRWKTRGDWSSNIINLGDAGLPPSPNEVAAAIMWLLEKNRRGRHEATQQVLREN